MPAAVAAAAVAAASGGALLLCLLLTCRPQPGPDAEREDEASPLLSGPSPARESGSGREEEDPWPDRAPVTCCEATAVAARTARRTWELTVGRWGLHGLAFGIKRHMKRQVSGIPPFDLPLLFTRSLNSGCVTVSASPARVSFSFALLCYYGIEA